MEISNCIYCSSGGKVDERYIELFSGYFCTTFRVICSDTSCIINNEDSKVMSRSFDSEDEAITYWNSLKI